MESININKKELEIFLYLIKLRIKQLEQKINSDSFWAYQHSKEEAESIRSLIDSHREKYYELKFRWKAANEVQSNNEKQDN